MVAQDPLADNAESDAVIPDASRIKVLKEPSSTRQLTRKEQILVLRAGYLNGVKFPPWQRHPEPRDFELKSGEEQFLDELSELPLSDFQSDVLDDWKRPQDALPPPTWSNKDGVNAGPHMGPRFEIDLVQDAATDCSVVASLCACTTRACRGHDDLLSRLFHPFDTTNKLPLVSANGKYILRLNFNGCFRWVVIDDRIPTSSTSRIIHVVDRNNPGLLWPALVEKAYLKVRGGYDFPGSNSGTDLWILTGWIPEQVFLQSDDLEVDRLWKRISQSFAYGDVLITIGTGKMSDTTEKALGLAGEHDYAVLDLREVNGQRLLLIKNPWVDGTSWRGRFTEHIEDSLAEVSLDTVPASDQHRSPRDVLNVDETMKPGTFWMDLANVLQYFESVYLNWNPGLFAYREDVHFSWDLSYRALTGDEIEEQGPNTNLRRNPQYAVATQKGGTVWLLLWRHFQNTVPENATAEEIENGRQEIDLDGHIAIVSFMRGGQRVILAERYLQKGWFVDSPQTLLKLDDCIAGESYTIVPIEQNLRSTNHTFTMSAFSNSPLTITEALPRYAHSQELTGAWGWDDAGGNAQYGTYGLNPQFSITVSQATRLSLILESDNVQYHVNVRLVYSNGGQRMERIRNRDIIIDSREYRAGCCLAETEELDPGKYTIICSTFEPQQRGSFTLIVCSTRPVTMVRLPGDGAGRFHITLPPAIFPHANTRIAIPLIPRYSLNFYAVAQPYPPRRFHTLEQHNIGAPTPSSHIRLVIKTSLSPTSRVRAISNDSEFEDSSGGMGIRTLPLVISQHDLHRNDVGACYWLLLERLYVSDSGAGPGRGREASDDPARSSSQVEERFVVELMADRQDAIDFGEWTVPGD